jgi:formate hydrogenlyase subunit 3/multisubunit Na+/H+ antiporter MnhD subunit
MVLLLPIAIPVAVAVLVLWRRLSPRVALGVAAVGPLPALALALFGERTTTVLPWLLLQTHLGLTTVTHVFLLFTSLLWTIAGIYAVAYMAHDTRQRGFAFFFLLTLAGNIGLILAADVASFYLFFGVMTFAGYGLVVHDRTAAARGAANIYIALAIVGELMLLAGIFLAVAEAGSLLLADIPAAVAASASRHTIIALLFFGFGVKAGVLGLHMWLPLAHPAAPTPASAVLSGTMIKAGLLGWIHTLPAGEVAMPGWSLFLICWGLTAAFFAVAVGVTQRDPKSNLAYSSISQMGVMMVGLGIGFATPAAWPAALGVLLVYAFSHALAKGTLFLGVGICAGAGPQRWKRHLALGGVFLAAVAIAGAPLTGGAVAKKALKDVAGYAPGIMPEVLDIMLPLTSLASTLLLGRFLFLVRPLAYEYEPKPYGVSLWWSWIFMLSALATGVWLAVPYLALEVPLPALAPAELWDGLWPILLGAVALYGAYRLQLRRPVIAEVPAGDVLWVIGRMVTYTRFGWRRRFSTAERLRLDLYPFIAGLLEGPRPRRLAAAAEGALVRWDVATALYLLLLLAFVAVTMTA